MPLLRAAPLPHISSNFSAGVGYYARTPSAMKPYSEQPRTENRETENYFCNLTFAF